MEKRVTSLKAQLTLLTKRHNGLVNVVKDLLKEIGKLKDVMKSFKTVKFGSLSFNTKLLSPSRPSSQEEIVKDIQWAPRSPFGTLKDLEE